MDTFFEESCQQFSVTATVCAEAIQGTASRTDRGNQPENRWSQRRRENMTTSREQGIVSLPSRSRVDETVQQLASIIESRGMTLFARIDQRAAANAVGLEMKPMVLLIFGNPKAGTPLMQ